jgi:two-component system response regulator YesN
LEEIRAVRIKKAKRLLADRRCELSVIANMCGYDSDTTFRRVFREETGMTMREWRRMHAAG